MIKLVILFVCAIVAMFWIDKSIHKNKSNTGKVICPECRATNIEFVPNCKKRRLVNRTIITSKQCKYCGNIF